MAEIELPSNRITLTPAVEGVAFQCVRDAAMLQSQYVDYLEDESNLGGQVPLELCFVESWEALSSYLAESSAEAHRVICAGAQTGLAGGAVAQKDVALLSLRKLHYIRHEIDEEGEPYLQLGAGVSLEEIHAYLAEQLPGYWFPVDPTETSASIGGAVALCAAGARSYRFGSVREWVRRIRVVLADGSSLSLARGQCVTQDGQFVIEQGDMQRRLAFSSFATLPDTKTALGYPLERQMDLIDLFIGSEGTLGVISDIELALAPRPKEFLYVLQFFKDERDAISFVSRLDESTELTPLAIESCDARALRLIENAAAKQHCRAIQHIQAAHQSAVYVELAAESTDELERILMDYMALLESSGIDPEDCFAGSEDKDIRDMKLFRHAIPETINAIIRQRKQEHPALHKLALDMAVPRKKRLDVFDLYRRCFEASGLEYTIFGHAGDAHFHVNILAKDEQQLREAKRLYETLARQIVSMGGAVAAEHGIGRMKKQLLAVQFDENILDALRSVRTFFDPAKRFAPEVFV